ncbi:hypothetical protein APS56_00835 [Pseudalgibacter alginicilyticus]|uniref:3-keto-disaccharide hydrolase domain-containing protein n=1 Tax=Pseudalgibacter alginicilyticus TaxID=1736674 RepID=A0A0N7HXY9_9FLAO|nr:hypothetical protein [Pseudalgibacter alginicilyticus]ALJ03782.1 hypothetical protein APS56_00835 [Pseudalgibacter alginicilyticus]
MRLPNLILLLLILGFKNNIFSQTDIPEGFQLVYLQDFESPQAVRDFEMTDSKAWRISETDIGRSFELFGKSDYKASVRSPFNIAIIKDLIVGDFILEADLNQTGKEYGHRDLCLFFGVNNPTNFYYTHIASVADDHANNIFLVNDEPRVKIATKTTKTNDWGTTESWHKVRVERYTASGSIKVYFDNMKIPIMEAVDIHFLEGMIGIGSFDDTGKFDNIKIWSNKVIDKNVGFFR